MRLNKHTKQVILKSKVKLFLLSFCQQTKRRGLFDNTSATTNDTPDKPTRELSPGLLSDGLAVDDLHYYIDQRFDTAPTVNSFVCGRKRTFEEVSGMELEDNIGYNNNSNNNNPFGRNSEGMER